MQIPVVHIDEIYLNQDAMLKYATGDHPYILKGAMEKWDLSKFTAGYLTKHFPDFTVDYYSTNMVNPDVAPISVPLHAALADLTSPSTRYVHTHTHTHTLPPRYVHTHTLPPRYVYTHALPFRYVYTHHN